MNGTSTNTSDSGQSKGTKIESFQALLKQDLTKNTVKKPITVTPYEQILEKLLESISAVDFKSLAGTGEDENELKRYQYIVICINEIIRYTREHKWPMCQYNEGIFIYNGAWWQKVDDNELKHFLGKAAERLGMGKFLSQYVDTRKKLLEQFHSSTFQKAPEPPAGKVLINLRNGTFEISAKKQELRDPRPEDFLTYQLPFDYDEGADAVQFMKYLDEVLPDKSRQMIIAEFLGSVFMPSLKHEKALLPYGSGANGKSVLFDVTAALIGEANTVSYSLKSLTGDRGANARACLSNKLLNYASEIGKGINEIDTFKALVSGEPVEARYLYKDTFLLKRIPRMMFNCNELPHDSDQTEAFFRRCLIVPFDITIPEEKRDKNLAKRIVDNELSGVFNWVLDGLKRLMESENNSFTKSEAIVRQLEEYRTTSDSVKMFVEDENYQPSNISEIRWRDFYSDYTQYCKENNYRPVNSHNFSRRLLSTGITTSKNRSGKIILAEKKVFN
jgi:putative DNA primase/helicase